MIESINILGIPHKVRYVEDGFRADATHFGEIEYEKAEIRINANMTDELKMQTLIHEWVHGALVQMGRATESTDEQLVQGLSVAIYQTFDVRKENNEVHINLNLSEAQKEILRKDLLRN